MPLLLHRKISLLQICVRHRSLYITVSMKNGPYTIRWREYRKRRYVWGIALVIDAFILHDTHIQPSFPTLEVFLGFLLTIITREWAMDFKCPRCGGQFIIAHHGLLYPWGDKTCGSCMLLEYTPDDPNRGIPGSDP
jgi:hypothetical protein